MYQECFTDDPTEKDVLHKTLSFKQLGAPPRKRYICSGLYNMYQECQGNAATEKSTMHKMTSLKELGGSRGSSVWRILTENTY